MINFNKQNIFCEMKDIKEKVIFLLVKYPSLRDSDTRLIATFWHNELNEKSKDINGFDLLQKIAKGELSKSESIRRVRCKLQEENPELRGKLYVDKQLLAEHITNNIHDL